MTTELWSWTATELAAAIRQGAISSVEATESAIARMEAVNPALNAVVDPLVDEAMEAARAADTALRKDGPLGPLHGVPITVKINVDYGGRATTNGVVAFKDLIAPEDGSVVRNLRAGQAVIIGRTNTPAFSMRWFTDNALHGQTLNPHDPDTTPGGSSGGAGAATAAGIGAFGHGNDIGGSIRYPAYCCGIYGLRPTVGLIPAYNPSQAAERLIASQMTAVQGPLARSVSDIALSMQSFVAPDSRDIWQVPAPDGLFEIANRPCRVAIAAETADCPVDPAVTAAIRQAGEMLADAGYTVEEVEIPSLDEAAALWRLVLGNEMRTGLWPLVEKYGDDDIKHWVSHKISLTDELNRADYLKAFSRRSTLLRQWQLLFDTHPLVLTANSWQRPFPVGADTTDDAGLRLLNAQQAPNSGVPMLGLPGFAVPVGSEPGRPMGVQLLAKRFREDILLAAGAVLERASGGPVRAIDPLHAAAVRSRRHRCPGHVHIDNQVSEASDVPGSD